MQRTENNSDPAPAAGPAPRPHSVPSLLREVLSSHWFRQAESTRQSTLGWWKPQHLLGSLPEHPNQHPTEFFVISHGLKSAMTCFQMSSWLMKHRLIKMTSVMCDQGTHQLYHWWGQASGSSVSASIQALTSLSLTQLCLQMYLSHLGKVLQGLNLVMES